MSKAAPRSSLANLHAKFTEYLTHVLEDAMAPTEHDEEGNVVRASIPLDAATMGCISKFLKDNEITCEPEDAATLAELRERYSAQARARSDNLASILEDAKGADLLN